MKKAKLKNEKTRMTNIGYVSKSKVIYVLSWNVFGVEVNKNKK